MQAQKRYDVLGQTSYAGIARIRFKATRNCGLFRSQPRMPLSAPVFMSNLLYTSTADCQAFQILSTRFQQVLHAFFNVLSSVPGILQLYSKNTQTGVIDRKKKRILCRAMAAAMTVSGYSATVDDSGASVSDSFSEYEAAKS